jgi:deoxyribodipyrimidine photo-lyase
MQKINIIWFRRDLRLQDNRALHAAMQSGYPVLPIFIFDKNILEELDEKDARVSFIFETLQQIDFTLQSIGSNLKILYSTPLEAFELLTTDYVVNEVFANDDYEPYAKQRDKEIADFLSDQGASLRLFKDHVIFEKAEIAKEDGKPYTVFTPYAKKWKANLQAKDCFDYTLPKEDWHFIQTISDTSFITLEEMGFYASSLVMPISLWKKECIQQYHLHRDYPGIEGTSKLSVHLRFGTISIRQLVRETKDINEKFLNELIWRDFYQSILWHFPHVVHQSFRPEYDAIPWLNNKIDFDAWCNGMTGYPIVDAGMRELNHTGWMHNRVRMVVASFLTKHLLIDWRWGEAYFAKKLNDYDLASNNGGWQWAAGCGVDAAPYFRIFNPALQTTKFDADLRYIRRWVLELDSLQYPTPIISHEIARERCLKTYKAALQKDK